MVRRSSCFGLVGGQPRDLLEFDPLLCESGLQLLTARAEGRLLITKLGLELGKLLLSFENHRQPSFEVSLFFIENSFQPDQLEPLVPGFPLELGSRREQPLAGHDFHVFANMFAIDLGPCKDLARLLLGIGDQPERCESRVTPQHPNENQSEDRDQQHGKGCDQSQVHDPPPLSRSDQTDRHVRKWRSKLRGGPHYGRVSNSI